MNESVEEDHCVDILANGNRDLRSTLATHGPVVTVQTLESWQMKYAGDRIREVLRSV